ncbi:hypothetical protein NDN08_003532 [Rhodosorus marinus]|uniref:PPIase FKBP-type domain-containing protein n=1 Tax=Rhodosorus marinus TaxID=101924 RepID=A0AAV8UX22_9RHOD|nr:hypothetical protein NDN08_003532 [Rhodosorus marinus]
MNPVWKIRAGLLFLAVVAVIFLLWPSGEADFSKEISAHFSVHKNRIVGAARENPWEGATRGPVQNQRIGSGIWRTFRRRAKGCGGTYRPSVEIHDQVRVRYVAKSGEDVLDQVLRDEGVLIDMDKDSAPEGLRKALLGACKGDLVQLTAPSRFASTIGGSGKHSSVGRSLDFLVEITGLLKNRSDRQPNDEDEDALAALISPGKGGRGEDCNTVCKRLSRGCYEAAFQIVNTCPRLRAAFDCTACEVAAVGTEGPDMPCYVSPRAPSSHPRGFCMVHTNFRRYLDVQVPSRSIEILTWFLVDNSGLNATPNTCILIVCVPVYVLKT